jgi:hypothetical protein
MTDEVKILCKAKKEASKWQSRKVKKKRKMRRGEAQKEVANRTSRRASEKRVWLLPDRTVTFADARSKLK